MGDLLGKVGSKPIFPNKEAVLSLVPRARVQPCSSVPRQPNVLVVQSIDKYIACMAST